MGRVSDINSSWLFGFLVSSAVCASASGFGAVQGPAQVPNTVNGTAAAQSSTTPAAQFGGPYGGAAGKRDGTLRLIPRPSRSPLYSNQRQYRPAYGSRADFAQQYRSAFEKAYRLAYETALSNHKPPAETPQKSGRTAGSN